MPPTIQQGSTGHAVTEAQYLLVRFLILASDQIDGSFGPATTNAVRELQSEEGLTVDGIVGANTWQAMLAVFSIPPTLKVGSAGSVVRRLQRALNNGRSEFAPGTHALATDGTYGPKTRPWSRPSSDGARYPTTASWVCGPGACLCTRPVRCSPASSGCDSTLRSRPVSLAPSRPIASRVREG
jgi:peptidoglycan hydrolase-like protein with peptidoglycan-binding domain